MNVAEPSAPGRGALRAGEDDEDLGVDVRAEVLLARETPFVAVLDGGGGVRTDVAAALALGQEHPAFPREVGIEAPAARGSSSLAPPSGP